MRAERQMIVYEFIRLFWRQQGIGPTMREIQKRFRFKSPNAAQSHVVALRRKGLLEKGGSARRGAVPTQKESVIPIFGTIPAGLPIEASVTASDSIEIDETHFGLPAGTPLFGLRVRGRSMTGAGINDGDIVFLTNRPARDRDIVAALIDGETTLKRYIAHPNGAVLHAENPDFPDLVPADELIIQGVMAGLLRCVP